jgi:anti-sigma B factor antagonist
LDIKIRQVNDVLAVDLVGRLDTETSSQVSGELVRIAQGGNSKVVLNFDGLDYVSSAGLRVILMAAKALRASHGELKICHANGLVKEVIDISGFNQILAVYETEKDALAAF